MNMALEALRHIRGYATSIFLVLLLMSLSLSQPIRAQTIIYQQTRTALRSEVHLQLGETTLTRALQELSQQVHLQIQAADYLQERELVVELNNMSAQAALDTLAEGNDWIWYEEKQGQIFVSRPKFNKTQKLLDVAPAFRAIVPKDLRRFVGVDVSDAEIRSAFRQSQPNSDYVLRSPEIINHLPPRLRLLPEMIEAPVKQQENVMVTWVTKEVRTGKKIPYSTLTPEQQHSLLVRFVFTAMHDVFVPSGASNLIIGLDPAGMDENQMRVIYQNGGIFVGTLQQGHFSFGEGIMSGKQLPDPLFLHTPF